MLPFNRLAEKIFVIVSLLLFTGAIGGYIAEENPLNIFRVIFIYIGHLVTLILIITRWKTVIPIVIKEKLLWALIGITLVSPLWSDIPMVTLGHIMPLLRVTVFGVYFATQYSLKEQLQLLAWAFGIAALLSLLVCLAVPYYGVVGAGLIVGQEEIVHTGAWRGLYSHKTILGSMMSVGSVVLLFCRIGKYKYGSITWAALSLSFFMLLRSTTAAALLILFVTILLIYFCKLERINFTLFIVIVLGLILLSSFLISVVASNAETIFNSFGKEVTISGRTLIWPLLLDKIWERPWLGYGYETFWEGGWEGEAADIWRGLIGGFEPPHAHNGFLELWLDIGLIGLSAFTMSFITIFWRSLIWLRKNKTVEGIVPLILLIQILFLNLTESSLMRCDIYWLIYVSLILSMYKNYNHDHFVIYQDNLQDCFYLK